MADDGFDVFWQAYPRKTAKADARKAWCKLAPDAALQAEILEALAWQVRQPQWVKDGGEFIPYPATWLRGERWADEPVRVGGRGAAEPAHGWQCPHEPRCINRWTCERTAQRAQFQVA
jgi:hypothetical protein